MNIHLDGQGWGEARTIDISKVLESVHSVFVPCFDASMRDKDLLIVHSDDHPVIYCQHSVILLSAKERFWCKYAYQFAHEYCHFQIGGGVPQQLRWFEESLCELSSHFFLPRISDLWKMNPPYSNWMSYAEQFRIYSIKDQQKVTPFNLDFSNDPDVLVYLSQNEYDRNKNAYVAISLMPIFEQNPRLWSSVHFIGDIPKHLSFSASLRCWRDLSPEEFRGDIEKIAKEFSITL